MKIDLFFRILLLSFLLLKPFLFLENNLRNKLKKKNRLEFSFRNFTNENNTIRIKENSLDRKHYNVGNLKKSKNSL